MLTLRATRQLWARRTRFKASKIEGALDRLILSDEQWECLAPHLPGKVGDPGRSSADKRMFVEGVRWIARVGAPGRDLLGDWNSVFRGSARWAAKLLQLLSGDPEFEYALIDGTIIRDHDHKMGRGASSAGGLEAVMPPSGT
jgi:transposase